MKNAFLTALLVLLCGITGAQNSEADSLPKKKYYKYLGIQSNLLLRQFISFNSNSSINTNPYIFGYARNNIQTGRGFSFGTGFNVSENSTNDGVASITEQLANLTFRIGSERKYLQHEKFIPFTGIDYGIGFVYSEVRSRLNQSITNTETVVRTTKAFIGPAFRGGLLYALSKHVLLGTEFFFNLQVSYTQTFTTNGGFADSFAPINIGFQAPTALFLVFRY